MSVVGWRGSGQLTLRYRQAGGETQIAEIVEIVEID